MSFFSGGRPITKTFTPPEAGVLVVSIVFDMGYTDFAGSTPGSAAVFCEQGGLISYGERVSPRPNLWQSLVATSRFEVAGGSAVVVGLAAYAGGLRSLSFRRLSLVGSFYPGATLGPPPAPTPAPPAPPPPPPPPPPGSPPPPPPPPPVEPPPGQMPGEPF